MKPYSLDRLSRAHGGNPCLVTNSLVLFFGCSTPILIFTHTYRSSFARGEALPSVCEYLGAPGRTWTLMLVPCFSLWNFGLQWYVGA